MQLRPPSHAALVVGVHGDEVGDSLGQAVDRGSGVPYDLPMGMELIGVDAPTDDIALGVLHGIPGDRHVAGILAPLYGEFGGGHGCFPAAKAEDAETADRELTAKAVPIGRLYSFSSLPSTSYDMNLTILL